MLQSSLFCPVFIPNTPCPPFGCSTCNKPLGFRWSWMAVTLHVIEILIGIRWPLCPCLFFVPKLSFRVASGQISKGKTFQLCFGKRPKAADLETTTLCLSQTRRLTLVESASLKPPAFPVPALWDGEGQYNRKRGNQEQ